jgi:threonine synthase
MGTPIDKLVCASNKNNVLTDFLKTGEYNRNRSFYTTMSPSMDILISSNLERLLYVLLGCEKTAEYMRKLSAEGKYQLSEEELALVSESFVGYYTDEADCRDTVKRIYENENRLIDTHTAVAVSAAERYMSDYKAKSKMLVVSTASAYKFAGDVLLSLSGNKPEDDVLALEALKSVTGVEIPRPLLDTLSKTPRFETVISKENMDGAVKNFALC